MRQLELIKNRAKERGLIETIKSIHRHALRVTGVRKLLMLIGSIEDTPSIREKLNAKFDRHFNSQVAYGPLKGFRFDPKDKIKTARAARIFGLWEKEVIDTLVSLSGKRRYLVDIGAADGFYSVGMLFAGLYEKSFNFEILNYRREQLQRTAELNNVFPSVNVFSEANLETVNELPDDVKANSVVLCDIEGGEFELLTDDILRDFQSCYWIIELHESHVTDGEQKLKGLVRRTEKYFVNEVIKTKERNLSEFPELEFIKDDERWLICSDGRGRLGKWLLLSPKV